MFAAPLQCTLAVWYSACTTMANSVEQALYHQRNGGTNTVPPLVMEMQTDRTNNHIFQIFFVLAAPM
jgi:hypothetical protein